MANKVCVIGHVGIGKELYNGQTVKTKTLIKELKSRLGDEQVSVIDTHGGVKVLFKCFFKVISALKHSENVIMLPAHNGVKFFAPLLVFWNLFFHRQLHYSVIGSWLTDLLKKNKPLVFLLKKFDYIYVETTKMKNKLTEMGFDNVYISVNCKFLPELKSEDLKYETAEPLHVCTFSRINQAKGIGDAASVIADINKQFGKTVYLLDIYGEIEAGKENWFSSLLVQHGDNVRYCGTVDPEKSVDTIKNYFALLFPTRYTNEGIPGTVIDAYFAAVPIICSKWANYVDIVDDGITGICYEFCSTEDLKKKLIYAKDNIDAFNSMKPNCLKKSKQYTPRVAMDIIIQSIYRKSGTNRSV